MNYRPLLDFIIIVAAIIGSFAAMFYFTGEMYDAQYNQANFATLEKTLETYKNAEITDCIFFDNESGYTSISYSSMGIVELYIVRGDKPGNALRTVYKSSEGRMMNIRESFKYTKNIEVYMFVCNPDGKMYQNKKTILNENFTESQKLPNNAVDYCRATGGCT
jgi:hypothetical protein